MQLHLGGQLFNNSVIVAELGGLSGIIGLDFLSENGFVTDISKGTLCSSNLKVQLFRENSVRSARVHIAETVHVSAHTEMFVKGEIRGDFEGKSDGCIQPIDNF